MAFLCMGIQEDSVLVVPRRSPTGALVRSGVLPGWGQLYNQKPLKALAYGVLQGGLLGWTLYENDRAGYAREMFLLTGDPSWESACEEHRNRRRSLIWYTVGAWVLSMMDAYVDASLFGFEVENRVFDRKAGLSLGVGVRF